MIKVELIYDVPTGNQPYILTLFNIDMDDELLPLFEKLDIRSIFDLGLSGELLESKDYVNRLTDALIILASNPDRFLKLVGSNYYNGCIYMLSNLIRAWRLYPNCQLRIREDINKEEFYDYDRPPSI